MNVLSKVGALLALFIILGIGTSHATNNQTDDLSPILPESGLPFSIVIEKANFQLPIGIHSGVVGVYKGLWIFVAGSHMGLHGFGANPFPQQAQNTSIYVVNPLTGLVLSRSLNDASSGLNQQQVDTLSAISPQSYQETNTLYITGGYGIDTGTGTFSTKPILTAMYLPGIVEWVTEPQNAHHTVIDNIRQISNPIFQIAGGSMFKLGNLTQLVFGQNFSGVYNQNSSGVYSEQVRQFQIIDSNGVFSVDIFDPKPSIPSSNFRRRDLNVVPVLLNNNNQLKYGLVAYSGVFTPAIGAWTVPVVINETGDPIMADPNLPTTFKQGMNQYACATAGLYSRKNANMYTVFFGGMSYEYYDGGFQTDDEIPFINNVTTIQLDKNGHFTQYLMDNQYPVIPSTGVNPGNTLYFGSGAYFLPNTILKYPNGVISLDSIRKETVIGYIVGGIQSTLRNTVSDADSSASAYVFKVTLVPK